MIDSLFTGLFDIQGQTTVDVTKFLVCVLAALLFGCMIAGAYSFKSKYTLSFLTTLILLPAVVCVVIMMVNGNIGAGIAAVGIFGLVRFRSVPGTAREIAAVFLAMGAGLISGMGYIGFAILYTIILCVVLMILNTVSAKEIENRRKDKVLKITIPESLDYEGVFDEVLAKYTSKYELEGVKTTAMGSLFKLSYLVTMKEDVSEKAFMDDIRCRNGNLEVAIVKREENLLEL